LARTPRTWTGARSPSGLKRVRQAQRRHEILQPRRSAAKTLVAKAVRVSTTPTDGVDATAALTEALSALDRAAKSGAIHPNAAARRKSRLVRKVNAALGGTHVVATAHVAKQVSKAQAQKAAKARIAAGRADKAKGAQTAAGKARAALTKTTRAETTAAPDTTAPTTEPKRPATKARAASTAAKKTSTTAKATTSKATAKKAPAKKAAPKG
jgi:ribosomal protein S20